MTQNNELPGDSGDTPAEARASAHEAAGLDRSGSAEASAPSRSEQAEELLRRQLENANVCSKLEYWKLRRKWLALT